MSYRYCSYCGHPNENDIVKPVKFCSKCGKDFAGAFKVQETEASKHIHSSDDEEEYEVVRIKKKKKLSREKLVETEDASFAELEAAPEDDSNFDESVAKELGKEIAQEINESDIQVSFGEKVEKMQFVITQTSNDIQTK